MTVAYKTYLIRETLSGFAISKDGYHISWANSLADAKATIDMLVS